MSTIIDFTKLGGYRLEQPTLAKMQDSYYVFLKALIGHLGIPDVGKFIISGCTIDGDNITEGILYIDGHICPFETSEGTLASKIAKLVFQEQLIFENMTSQTVFTRYSATIDDAGTALSEFIRVPSPFNLPTNIVIDANYNNFSTEEKAKLAGIQSGAQVNVKPSWAQNNPAAANYIEDKPEGKLMTYLRQGVIIHGDLLGSHQVITESFPNIGTAAYKVLPTIVGTGSNANSESRVNCVIRNKTPTSFQIAMHDMSDASGQNLRIEYIMVPDDNS